MGDELERMNATAGETYVTAGSATSPSRRSSGGAPPAPKFTLRRGTSATILGRTYTAGERYDADDPGVRANPGIFILAPEPKPKRAAPPSMERLADPDAD